MFKKHTEEIKKEVDDLVESGKVLSIGVLAVSCLTIGYILGSVTTGTMWKTMIRVR